MSDKDQIEIFRRNLIRYLGNTPQVEVANAIGVSPQAFNRWTQGISMPRIGKVQLLADYFRINKSDLIEEKEPTEVNSLLHDIETLNPDYQELVADFVKELQADEPNVADLASTFSKILQCIQS